MTDELDSARLALSAAMAALRKYGFPYLHEFSPEVYRVFRIDPANPYLAARDQVRRKLIVAAERSLDQKRRTAFLGVAALARPSAPREVKERSSQAAETLGCSERTVLRYFETAAEQVVTTLLSTSERPVLDTTDYAFVRSRTRVDLRDEAPYLVMERTINTRSDDIDHIDDRIELPHYAGDELPIRALEGCRIEQNTKIGPNLWAVRLAFPRKLHTGDQHSFATSIKLPDRPSLAPIALFLPHTPSTNATLELRFGERRPAVLERFITPPRVDLRTELPNSSERISPVLARHDFVFHQMQPGLCHGARWRWEDPDVSDS